MVSCGIAAKPSRMVHHFVPPAPKAPEVTHVLQDPPLERNLVSGEKSLFDRESPVLVARAVDRAQQSAAADYAIQQAEQHYSKGSVLMGRGETAAARIEFDRAIETLSAAPSSLPDRARLAARYRTMVEDIYRMEVELASQSGPTPEPAFDKAPLEEVADLTFPVDPGLKGKVRAQLQATVSQLPLEMADPVLSFINYFQSPRGRDTLVSGLFRSGRYAPMIRRILDEEGLPQELIYLAQAESGFLPRAVSYMSATGMWQFMQFRGREYGLNQSQYTDDRLDPERATRAAARHLRDLYAEFGDWYLAIAAYNCGPLAVDRAIQRTGFADFWELYKRNVLPKETANYVPIILAMTIMAKNPKDYGLEGVVVDKPMDYDTVKAGANTHLALVADLVNRPLSEIRDLNPAVLRLIAPENYEIRVPKGSGKQVIAGLDTIPSSRRASWRIHRVTQQETVMSIASKYKVTERSISEANSHQGEEPQAGDVLLIPVAYEGVQPVFTNASYQRRPVNRSYSQQRRPVQQTWKRPATTAKSGAKPASRAGTRPTAAAARKPAAKPQAVKPVVPRQRAAARTMPQVIALNSIPGR